MSQIKSKERVRDLAEVFTNEREVKAMLDLIPFKRPDDIISYRFLEPACGNGNFLVEILARKLERINAKYQGRSLRDYEFSVVKAVSSIYGIDICPDNIAEARNRLLVQIKSNYDLHNGSYLYSDGFLGVVQFILEKNLVVGDSINRPGPIEFTEFRFKGKKMSQRVFRYVDMIVEKEPQPLDTADPENYLSVGIRKSGKQLELNYERNPGHTDLI